MNKLILLSISIISASLVACGGGDSTTTSTPTPVAGCAGSAALVSIAFSPTSYILKLNQPANIVPSTLNPYSCVKSMSFTSGLPYATGVLNLSPPNGLSIVDGALVGIPTKTGVSNIAVGITSITGYSLSKTVYSNTITINVIP
jgi:hypothetical protein